MRQGHVPVLVDRVVALVAPVLQREGSVFVDATVGLGGHTEAVLRACPRARALGIDRDPQALEVAADRLAEFGERVLLVHAVDDELTQLLAEHDLPAVEAVLFDLGVSSWQLDQGDRGFAYAVDAPLDMRMDQTRGISAAEVLATYAEADLAAILRDYGEERFARRIAAAIVEARRHTPVERSDQLVELVRSVVPMPARRRGGHPAKRTFQALRVEVNQELDILRRALPQAIDSIDVGGRIVVMAYQSLEDRIVKRVLATRSRSTAPDGLPVVPRDMEPELRLLTRGAEQADDAEIAANPRAQSVRLRAAERVRAAA